MNPHTLAFQIGGKVIPSSLDCSYKEKFIRYYQTFPIDPRDFVGQFEPNDAQTCVADNIVPTDPPSFGSLFRWSLGDPFFRSLVLLKCDCNPALISHS